MSIGSKIIKKYKREDKTKQYLKTLDYCFSHSSIFNENQKELIKAMLLYVSCFDVITRVDVEDICNDLYLFYANQNELMRDFISLIGLRPSFFGRLNILEQDGKNKYALEYKFVRPFVVDFNNQFLY